MILDGPKGTLDPAFDAHCLPIMRWAQAWYEGWQSPRALTQAFADAKLKVAKAKRSVWDVAAGPTASLLGTLARIKWEHNGPSILSDDIGRVFNLTVDPPVVIANAVKASVRRWRLAKACAKFPSLCPDVPDYVDPRMSEDFLRHDGLVRMERSSLLLPSQSSSIEGATSLLNLVNGSSSTNRPWSLLFLEVNGPNAAWPRTASGQTTLGASYARVR